MTFELLLILVVIAGFVGLFFAIRAMLLRKPGADIENIVNQAFGKSASVVAEQSRQILEGEKKMIATDVAHTRRNIEEMVKRLEDSVAERQKEIHDLEKERSVQFSTLKTDITNHRKLTDELRINTEKLAKVLSNNQARGEWGERIIEDLLTANGLQEGVHYSKQRSMTTSNDTVLRPDITLLLPNERIVPIDVKFPYQSIARLVAEDGKAAQAPHLKQFRVDLKTKIDKVAEYIDPAAETLDYAILFVPNEMVFSFINQQIPDMVDYAIKQRVLLVSPFTFIIVAKTVMESYRNFMITDSLRKAVKYIDEFVVEWDKFKGQFEKYGRTLGTLQSDYEQLTQTRVRQMEKRVDKVQSYASGKLLDQKKEEKKLE
ncbi:MAG: DNA recombination protein RmuC [Patescibacteria group bacterium]